ncbi:MAG TPA: glucose-1-phosphate cytidylyltransferase [Aurantimonas coralicida]|uniref:Glucose-1-phosphate cytidylyltransferase n=2 Tax=root TaxID=1 RepID=A0A9C9NHE9_9HYPH|nr:glucose-1-phosphate cytidylyltransferase [Aurantimonas coralicida]HEU01898.1 glucose-1-phosphate cytidylyltransferase [Aurantimonas coralicida]
MKVVILAGGRGSRLAEETSVRPKPLVEIGEKPIIWHIMSIYAHFGFKDFIVCAGYKGYQIKEYFANLVLHHSDVTVDLGRNLIHYHQSDKLDWRVSVIDTGLDTMTGGRLKRAKPYLTPGEPFCMTYGDGVADVDVAREAAFHRAHGLKATMCTVAPPGRFGTVNIEGERVSAFVEKPTADTQRINGGFFVLQPEVLDLIEGDGTVWESGPLERLVAEGQLASFRHDGFWRPMDTLRERIHLDEMWNAGAAPWKIWT